MESIDDLNARNFFVRRMVLFSMLRQRLVISFCDPTGGFRGILMLPDADNSPPQGAEPLVGVLVPFHVLAELPPPPLNIGFRLRTMNRAVVPKAPIDKDCKARSRKDDVDFAIGARDQSLLDPESQPLAVQSGSYCSFGATVCPPGRGHSAAGLG